MKAGSYLAVVNKVWFVTFTPLEIFEASWTSSQHTTNLHSHRANEFSTFFVLFKRINVTNIQVWKNLLYWQASVLCWQPSVLKCRVVALTKHRLVTLVSQAKCFHKTCCCEDFFLDCIIFSTVEECIFLENLIVRINSQVSQLNIDYVLKTKAIVGSNCWAFLVGGHSY